jgi:hypothetical protein
MSILERLDPAIINQLSDAFTLLPDIAVVKAASDRVDERIEWLDEPILVQRPCCGQGCTHCGNTQKETD